MSYGLNFDAKQIILAHKSRVDRLETELKNRIAERDKARAIAVDLEQRLTEVMRSLQAHIEYRRGEHEWCPGDINSMAVTAAESALKWAEVAHRPVYEDDLMEEVPF